DHGRVSTSPIPNQAAPLSQLWERGRGVRAAPLGRRQLLPWLPRLEQPLSSVWATTRPSTISILRDSRQAGGAASTQDSSAARPSGPRRERAVHAVKSCRLVKVSITSTVRPAASRNCRHSERRYDRTWLGSRRRSNS